MSVFRAYRDADRSSVVLKLLPLASASPQSIARLRHEHRILNSLESPYVVRTLGLVTSAQTIALVLEDLGSRSVTHLVVPGGMDIHSFLQLAIALTGALGSVHQHHLVHKDIKPHHFLLDEATGQPKLIDFGIATDLPWQVQQTVSVRELEGTLAYLSPEQTGRIDRALDRRTDLYSLGVTLYELLTGVLPFRTTDPLELIHSHVARAPQNPRKLRRDVPDALAAIVLKLLSKVAEERYHTAAGLEADLQACLTALESQGRIPELTPGAYDISDVLCVARRLYGRESDTEQLRLALERVCQGAVEFWLVRGPSGVGKSSLARQIHQLIPMNGRFITGKSDHVDRATPYAPIAHACRALVRSLLGEAVLSLDTWRKRLLRAVGSSGQLVIDLIPELELVIGKQPPVQHLDASEARHRFELVLQSFFRVFTSADHPLVLFLDDLQWADPASIRWLELVLGAPDRGHLLVVGACRDHEVERNHPLDSTLQKVARAGAVVHTLDLKPLELPQIRQLLADTLACSGERVQPLAELIRTKTGGNPFFIDQILQELYRTAIVWFDARQRIWTWDLQRVEQVAVTENVVDLMVTRLGRLPESTLRVLRLAACMGHQFDCQALSIICELEPTDVAAELESALRQGLVLPLDAELHNWILADASSGSQFDARKVAYRFLHDRIKQAAYESIEPSARGRAHLNIGRLMLARADGHPADDQLFIVVDHLNRGVADINDIGERHMLARLNLLAGQRARDAAAHDAASKLLSTTLDLLGGDAWSRDRESAHAAHVTRAECEFLSGHVDTAFALLDAVEAQARSPLESVPARALRTTMLTRMNRLPEAVRLAMDTVSLLGAEFSTDQAEIGRALGEEFAALQRALSGRSIESLIDLPAMTDAARLALVDILFRAGPGGFQFNPELMVLTVIRVINMAIHHGNAAVLPYFYESYGIIHPVITGDYDTAYRFGRLGVDYYAKHGPSAVGGATYFVFAAFISHWRKPLPESIDHFQIGLRASLEIGDHIHAGYCLSMAVFHRFYRGENLAALIAESRGVAARLERADDVINLRQLSILDQLWKSLMGTTSTPGSFDSDGFDEEVFRQSFQGNRSLHVFYYVHKLIALYFAGDCAGALAASEQAVPLQPGLFLVVEHRFYQALSLATRCWSAPPEERGALLDALRAEAAKLHKWAMSRSPDHAHRHALVAAELAALEGEFDRAAELYDQAISIARSQDALHVVALASELAGEIYLRRGRKRIAHAYLADAYRGYLDWGALARANRVVTGHAELALPMSLGYVPRAVTAVPRGQRQATTADTPANSGSSTSAGNTQFDLMTAVRASQVIASELKLERVLDRLLRVLLEHAGAQKGCLVLVHGESLVVEACATIDPDEVRVGLAEPLPKSSRLATSVVQYVARSLESVALSDGATDPVFARDPYVVACRARSLLCLPMQHRGHLVGVLYLENNAATHVFSPSRVELLEFLVAQAAIALENAGLYGELEAASQLLRRSNEELEAQVAQRTEQLSRALADLWSEMDLARKIQTVLLPNDQRVGDCQIAASMVPASSVGGDYYDTFQCGSSSWLLIGDVSGHGVTAGLSMMMVQTAVRSIVETAADSPGQLTPARVLAKVNAVVSGNLARVRRGQYVTLTAIEIRGATVKHAGLHMDLLLFRAATHRVERIPTGGLWVGVVPDLAPLLEDSVFELDAGDVLLLFTDGITEAMVGNRRLGTEGLAALLGQLASQSSAPDSIIRGINRYMAGSGTSDDMTVVAVRYAPNEGEVAWTKN